MIEGPWSPGTGLLSYQPAASQASGGCSSSVWSRASTSRGASTPIDGMLMPTGGRDSAAAVPSWAEGSCSGRADAAGDAVCPLPSAWFVAAGVG